MALRSIACRLRELANRLHRFAGNYRFLTDVAVKLRNQCECVIGYALGEDAEVTDEGNSERWLIASVARDVNTFFDVGANRGDWTRALLDHNPAAAGAIFEPVDWCFGELQKSFGGNPKLHLFQVALSDRAGRAAFGVMPGNVKTSSLFVDRAVGAERVVDIEVTTVDEIAASLKWPKVNFLKVDCEGSDLLVLRGAEGMLASDGVDLVQFEYNTMWPHSGCTLAAALQLLRRYGFVVWLLRQQRLSHFDYKKWGEFFRFANFVAIRRGTPFEATLKHATCS